MAPEEDGNGPEPTEAGPRNAVNWPGDIQGSPTIIINQVNIEGVPAKELPKVLEELKELKKELDSKPDDINVVQGRRLFEDRSREPSEEELESARKSVRMADSLVQQDVKFEPWDLLSFALSALSLADDTESEMWGIGNGLLGKASWEFMLRRDIVKSPWNTQEEFWERQFESHEENQGAFFSAEFSELWMRTIEDENEEEYMKRRKLEFKRWYSEEVVRGVVECTLNEGKVLLQCAREKNDAPHDWRESYFELSKTIQREGFLEDLSKEHCLQYAEESLWQAYATLYLKCHNTYTGGRNRGQEGYVERKMGDIMCLRAEIASERGELDSARRIYQEAYGIAFGTGYWRLEYQILGALADLAVQRGDAGEAERLLDDLIVLSNKHRDWYGERRGLIRLAEVADQQGDGEKADEIRSAIGLRRVQHYAHEVDHNDS